MKKAEEVPSAEIDALFEFVLSVVKPTDINFQIQVNLQEIISKGILPADYEIERFRSLCQEVGSKLKSFLKKDDLYYWTSGYEDSNDVYITIEQASKPLKF